MNKRACILTWGVTVAGLMAVAAWGQSPQEPSQQESQPSAETAPAASQPTSAPAEEVNPLPSAARMIGYFDAAVAEDHTEDALRCLNFGQVDAEVRREKGGEFLTQLVEIIRRLDEEDLFDRSKLSDDPTAPPQTIGKDPLLLVLEREKEPREGSTVRLWQFSATTVKRIPEMYAQLEKLAELTDAPPVTAPVETPAEASAEKPVLNRLRSPYHTVEFFLVKVADAEKDTSSYVDAMSALDFSLVAPEVVAEQGPRYVDQLARIMAHLRTSGEFDREALPKEPAADVDNVTLGSDPLLVILVRQPDGSWLFSAQTVQRIPEMADALKQLSEKAEKEGEPVVVEEALRLDTSSPRATMNLFLTSMAENDLRTAISCLDLSRLTSAEREVAGVLAGKLLLVLNRHAVIVLQDIDSNPDRKQAYTVLLHTAGRIEIDRKRTRDPDGTDRTGEWLFSAATVNSIEELYKAFESKPILPEFAGQHISFWQFPSLYVREYLVPAALKRPAAGLQTWQWYGVAFVLVAGVLVRIICALVLPILGQRFLSSEGAAMLPRALRTALRPTFMLAMVATWWGGLQFLDLGAQVMSWIWWYMKILLALVAVLAVYRALDLLVGFFMARAARTESRLDDVLVPLMHKTAKVLVVAVGVLFVGAAFGFEIGPLLAGFGLGGLAFGLAAQDTLKNFFGSVNVVLDRPFQVGDWVKIGDVEGTVEAVGLRSSRLRTFYNSQITVPNSEIMNARIDNMGRRRYRRISCHISVTYDTPPEKLEAFCEGIRELIRQHPYTRKDYYHVYVHEFAASSIDILLYTFHEAPEWGTELRERHRLFLDIVRLAQRLGVEFAFPTQTVHLHHESNPPADLPAPPPNPPAEADGAMQFGRDEAARIVREAFGETVDRPPPVEY